MVVIHIANCAIILLIIVAVKNPIADNIATIIVDANEFQTDNGGSDVHKHVITLMDLIGVPVCSKKAGP